MLSFENLSFSLISLMPFRKVHKAGTGKRWVLFLENENKKGVKGTGILATYN